MYNEKNESNRDQYNTTKTILLASFISKRKLIDSVEFIKNSFTIDRNRIFVLADIENDDNDLGRYILTYNIIIDKSDLDIPFHKRIPNTIKINRNKLYNCLYTLDALNAIIIEKTGARDDQYEVDWSEFKNCLLTTDREGKLVVSKTKVESIQNIGRN